MAGTAPTGLARLVDRKYNPSTWGERKSVEVMHRIADQTRHDVNAENPAFEELSRALFLRHNFLEVTNEDGTQSQFWELVPTGSHNSSVQIRNRGTGLCLELVWREGRVRLAGCVGPRGKETQLLRQLWELPPEDTVGPIWNRRRLYCVLGLQDNNVVRAEVASGSKQQLWRWNSLNHAIEHYVTSRVLTSINVPIVMRRLLASAPHS